MENFPFYLSLIVTIVLLIMLADKIKVAYPVLLVLAGLAISFIPGNNSDLADKYDYFEMNNYSRCS